MKLNNETTRKLYRMARDYGFSHEDAEEMQQEYHLKQLQGLAQKQSVKYFLFDQIRLRGYGRGKTSRSEVVKALSQYNDPSYDPHYDKALYANRALQGFSLEERVIIVLHAMWGFSSKEIGFVIGLSVCDTHDKMELLGLYSPPKAA